MNYSQPLWDGLIDAAKDPAKISKIDLAGGSLPAPSSSLVAFAAAGAWCRGFGLTERGASDGAGSKTHSMR